MTACSEHPVALQSASSEQGNTYNTGVILYKKSDRMDKFFTKWVEAAMQQDETTMRPGYRGDQYYFNQIIINKAHLECGIKLGVIDNRIYNARHPMIWHLQRIGEMGNVKILHCHDLHRSFLMRQFLRILTRIKRDSFFKKMRQASGNSKS